MLKDLFDFWTYRGIFLLYSHCWFFIFFVSLNLYHVIKWFNKTFYFELYSGIRQASNTNHNITFTQSLSLSFVSKYFTGLAWPILDWPEGNSLDQSLSFHTLHVRCSCGAFEVKCCCSYCFVIECLDFWWGKTWSSPQSDRHCYT